MRATMMTALVPSTVNHFHWVVVSCLVLFARFGIDRCDALAQFVSFGWMTVGLFVLDLRL